MFRLLRIFRVLKLLKTIPQLRIIVEALGNGFKSIGFIGIILMLFFYVFAILGGHEGGHRQYVRSGEGPRSDKGTHA